MANYDDFDLDIRKIKGNMEAEPKGTAAICLTTGTATTCTMPTLCDTSIVTLASCDGTCVGLKLKIWQFVSGFAQSAKPATIEIEMLL